MAVKDLLERGNDVFFCRMVLVFTEWCLCFILEGYPEGLRTLSYDPKFAIRFACVAFDNIGLNAFNYFVNKGITLRYG